VTTCPACGGLNRSDAHFCRTCGAQLTPAPSTIQVPQPAAAAADAVPSTAAWSTAVRGLLIGAFAVIALAVAALVVWAAFTRQGDSAEIADRDGDDAITVDATGPDELEVTQAVTETAVPSGSIGVASATAPQKPNTVLPTTSTTTTTATVPPATPAVPAAPPPQPPTTVTINSGDFGLSEPVTADEAAGLFEDYLLAAGARSLDEAWSMLEPGYQTEYGSRAAFDRFWSGISLVGIDTVSARTSQGTTVTLDVAMWYDVIGSGRQGEIVEVDVTRIGGRLLIADYRFIRRR
jgi:hypothetical protein